MVRGFHDKLITWGGAATRDRNPRAANPPSTIRFHADYHGNAGRARRGTGRARAGRGNSSLLAREFASKVIKAIAVESRFPGKAQRCGPLQGPGCGAQRGRSRAETPPPLSSVEVGDRCCGQTPIGAVIRGSFVLPCTCAVTLCTCAVTLCTCAVTLQESCGPRQRSIVGYGICVRASTVDAGFPRKAQRPRLPPVLSRSGVDVKDSPIRASTRGSFVLPCTCAVTLCTCAVTRW